MRYSNLALATLITLLALVRAIYTNVALSSLEYRVSTKQPRTDPESLLARAEKLPLICLNLAELELIPGMSDTLASSLLSARSKVLSAYRQTHNYSALTLVEGVAEKRAQTLSAYLDLNAQECAVDVGKDDKEL